MGRKRIVDRLELDAIREHMPIPTIEFTLGFEEFIRYHRLAPYKYRLYNNGVVYNDVATGTVRHFGFTGGKDLHRYRRWMAIRRREQKKYEEAIKREHAARAKYDFIHNEVQRDIDAETQRAEDCLNQACSIFEEIKRLTKLRKSLRVRSNVQ